MLMFSIKLRTLTTQQLVATHPLFCKPTLPPFSYCSKVLSFMENRGTTHLNPCNPLPPFSYCSELLTRIEKMSVKQSHVTAFALLIHNSPSPLQPPLTPPLCQSKVLTRMENMSIKQSYMSVMTNYSPCPRPPRPCPLSPIVQRC